VRRVALIGSVACGDETAESDIDLLTWPGVNTTRERLNEAARVLEQRWGRRVHIVTPLSVSADDYVRMLGDAILLSRRGRIAFALKERWKAGRRALGGA
jgi:predicted nucleotidyltransferase